MRYGRMWRLWALVGVAAVGTGVIAWARPAGRHLAPRDGAVAADAALPPLPASWPGLAGEVRIVRHGTLHAPDSSEVWGYWDEAQRTVHIDTTSSRAFQWYVLHHELFHAALDQSGYGYLLSPHLEEALANMVAAMQLRAMLRDR